MNFSSNSNTALFFSSIDEISNEIWTQLECENNLYFHRDFLKSIEINHSEINFYYIVLVDNSNKPIALASIQIVDFYLDTVKTNFEDFIRKIKNLLRKLYILPNKKALKLLISGNTFVSGEHGIFITHNQDKKQVIKNLAKAILHFVNSNNSINIDAFLLKDFVNESLFITDELKNYNYHPFSVEPNMILEINEDWISFEDYLNAIKTKFRVKAKKALQLSKDIIIKEVNDHNIENKLPQMTSLYKKVVNNADFNLSHFNLESYKTLKSAFGEKYILKTYELDGKIVGFMSGMINQNSLDAHFVGLDYSLNRQYAIYQRMLYDYIQIAIAKKIKTLNFGRTASEIKSSVGAKPQDLTMYLRHKKGITNKIVKLFLQYIQPSPFRQHFPFKNIKNE
ncbi:peptidogalycan biosysnthesis protein [Polaribacter marinivivus]|uniref:Peptidogalycan biosysnthesis protein n=1 Tax=Polaribacter marinivivus TaxID=1524260 RepID=A0ABV8R6W7_9FLAO